ncbi:MAG: ATP-binding cassette domain-containing protein [Lachnospiraceae bacterium]|nr:ATP-binding cassette domain-containing protein [Lachnospiraceae bacterium]
MIIGIILLVLVSTPVVLSFFWLPYDVNSMDSSVILQAPSFRHCFGTDNFGRDIFCRVIVGTRATFLIAIFTVVAGAGIGTVIGALTGYYGGVVDEILMRVNDCLASFPSILLALVVVSILDKGLWNVCIALGLVFIPSFARIMRSEFIEQSKRDYVASAKLMGASDFRIIFVHIFPNTFKALLAAMLVGLNNAVLAEAGLSFLGLGVEPPDPSLGRMLSEAQVYIWGAPWYVISASLVMVVMILGISLVSENIGEPAVNLKRVKRNLSLIRRGEKAGKSADGKPEVLTETGGKSSGETGGKSSGETRGKSSKETGTGSSKESSKEETNKEIDEKKKAGKKVLDITGLRVGFISDSGINEVINGISFSLDKGEILGIVGESGSGKSVTALTIMGIAPKTSAVTHGSIHFTGRGFAEDLTELDEAEYCKIRGKEISMIFQEPMTSLNPLQTVGEQIDEVLDLHAANLSAGEQRQRVIAAMADTGLKDPDSLYNKYPHELSGGMRQRIMIAMAVIAGAKVIIADEPTTALDADLADVILEIFRRINEKYGTSIILISHDLEVIAKICGRALIMRDGIIEEEIGIRSTEAGKKEDHFGEFRFEEPKTEYGKRLLAAAFADKSYIEDSDTREIIMSARNYNVFYRVRNGLFRRKSLKQVNFDINMDIRRGDCVGLVGESGCGKTTFVKGVAGLQKYTSGTMEVKGGKPAFVFQDPMSSLNPSKTVGWVLEESLKINTDLTKERRVDKVKSILKAVDLDETLIERKVTDLSGGQRQRVSIATSIILKHDLIILDEPVSALDVTIREQILELLMKLKKEYDLTFIVISHDRRLIGRICNVVYYMENGVIK